MQLRPFVPQSNVDDNQVNQKNLYFDANEVEDADIFEKNIPSARSDTSYDETEENIGEFNTGMRHQCFPTSTPRNFSLTGQQQNATPVSTVKLRH